MSGHVVDVTVEISEPMPGTCCATGWSGWQVIVRDATGVQHHHFDTEAEAKAFRPDGGDDVRS